MLAPESKVTARELPGAAADVLERIRSKSPRVHCITNVVAQNFTANMLLALGATPSMTIAPDEIAEFMQRADALLVNLGTLDPERRISMPLAIEKANERGIPWILDPVFVDRSKPRTEFATTLITDHPKVVRLNRAEFAGLSGQDLDGATLARFADASGAVIGLTGETDVVFDKGRLCCISNGDPMMARVTAMGCAGSALIGACMAVEDDAWLATACGLLLLGIAGEVAALRASGPGSLAVRILDTLYSIDRALIAERARVV